MREGLLWFDNNPNVELTDKIRQAAARYRVRLKQKPTVCYLNPNQLDGESGRVNGIQLKAAAYIRPHYLWIGVENEAAPSKAA